MRSMLALSLCVLMICPPGLVGAAPSGIVQGKVTVDGRPLGGMDLSLVNIGSGAVHSARSAESGEFELSVEPGAYVITGESQVGLSVARAPAVVNVEPGKVASANLEFVALAVPLAQEATEGGATIQHDPVGCMVAGEFPILDGLIEPATSVVRARVYFRSALSEEWYFVEMTQVEGVFRGWLPRPQVAASPISYYIQTTTTDFGESRTAEFSAMVVEFEDECGDLKPAAYGQPPGELTVFSASTGAAAGVPAGFAAGGLALGAGAIAAIVAGVAAAGAGIAAATDDTTTTTTSTTTATTTPTTTTPTTLPAQFRITVTVQPSPEFGTVTLDPPGGFYDPGTIVRLTAAAGTAQPASPAQEIRFIGWGLACAGFGTNEICRLEMDSDKLVIASFRLVPITPVP